MKPKIQTTIKYNAFSMDWSLLIIDKGNPGTHEEYNVVFNSDCVGKSYKRKGIAQAEAQAIIYKYKNEQ